MNILLDKTSVIPLGEQLQTQISLAIQQGELEPEQKLPTVKDLTATLELNYNTVAAAYRALERSGYLTQNRRAGTRVADNPPQDPEQTLAAALSSALSQQLEALKLDTDLFIKVLAATRQSKQAIPRYRLAVVAETPLAASQLAEKARGLLGEQADCVPQTLQTYESELYHLTLVDPNLLPKPQASANVIPTDSGLYGEHFPAGAD